MDMTQFHQDHAFLRNALRRLADVHAADPASEALDLAIELRVFDAKFRLHLVVEDRFLYPELIKSREREVVRLATEMREEMGLLYEDYKCQLDRCMIQAEILADPQVFISDTRRLLAQLAHRIEREDRELYPLAGALSPP